MRTGAASAPSGLKPRRRSGPLPPPEPSAAPARSVPSPSAPPLPPRPAARPPVEARAPDDAASADVARRLQAALLELLECKRILDGAR